MLEVMISLGMMGLISLNSFHLFFRSSQFSNQIDAMSSLELMNSKLITMLTKQTSCDVFLKTIREQTGTLDFSSGSTISGINQINKIFFRRDTGIATDIPPGGSEVIPVISTVPLPEVSNLSTNSPVGPTKPFSIFYYTQSMTLNRIQNSNMLRLIMRFEKIAGSNSIWPRIITRTINFKGIFDTSGNILTSCQVDENRAYHTILNNTCEEIKYSEAEVRDGSAGVPSTARLARYNNREADQLTDNFVECHRYSYDFIDQNNDWCGSTQRMITGFTTEVGRPFVIIPDCIDDELIKLPNPACPTFGHLPEGFDATGWGTFTNCSNLTSEDIAVGFPGDDCTPRVNPYGGAVISTLNLTSPPLRVNCP